MVKMVPVGRKRQGSVLNVVGEIISLTPLDVEVIPFTLER